MEKSEDDFTVEMEMPIEFIDQLIKTKEAEYIESLMSQNNNGDILSLKEDSLDNFCKSIENKDRITDSDYETIRNFASSPGGFLKMKYRKLLYKKICCVESRTDGYDLIYINKSDNSLYQTKEKLYIAFTSKEMRVIEVDVIRSFLNTFFPVDQYNRVNLTMKKILAIFINKLTSFNNEEFNYYQGYHDLSLLFLIIFLDNIDDGTMVFQRFSEFILKENLMAQDPNGQIGYTFVNCIQILTSVIKTISKKTYSILNEYSNGQAPFTLSWLLTLFTHNLNSIFLQMRLIDFFIVNHPIAIYDLVGQIASEHIHLSKTKYDLSKTMNQFKNFFSKKNNDDVDEFDQIYLYKSFQELNVNTIDFELYIEKTEKHLKNFDILATMKVFEQSEFKL